MKIEEVRKLSPLSRFLYWISERHAVFLRRKAGKPKPWSDDEIIQSIFFTNPYRENDKTTCWFRENVRDPLRNDPAVLMATVIFRWFNLISTGEVLSNYGYLTDWNKREVVAKLSEIRREGGQIFTGAFMVNSPGGEPKLEAICRRIKNVWEHRHVLLDTWPSDCTMEAAHKNLLQFEGLGGFMAYEIVCDLRYTYLLESASDKLTWSNPGPGAVRGLCRVLEREFPKGNNASSPPIPKDWSEQTQNLLRIVQKRLTKLPPFEAREIEMSLCEADKYERILWNDGRAKRKFKGV